MWARTTSLHHMWNSGLRYFAYAIPSCQWAQVAASEPSLLRELTHYVKFP